MFVFSPRERGIFFISVARARDCATGLLRPQAPRQFRGRRSVLTAPEMLAGQARGKRSRYREINAPRSRPGSDLNFQILEFCAILG
jgi:hypothetical protein